MTAKRAPPRFVPTLTEVVQAPVGGPAPVPAGPAITEEQLVQRVLKRVDLSLERRLREAISAAVLDHTRGLGPVLRERVETMVREAVSEAIAEEAKPRQRGGP